jgi:hypothetical protein
VINEANKQPLHDLLAACKSKTTAAERNEATRAWIEAQPSNKKIRLTTKKIGTPSDSFVEV